MVEQNKSTKEFFTESNYKNIEKQELRRIEISELPKEIPDFSNSFESKDSIIKKSLCK